MRWKVCSLFALSALLATSAYAGGDKCTYDTQACLNHWAGSAEPRAGSNREGEDGRRRQGHWRDAGQPGGEGRLPGGDMLTAINGMTIGSDALKNSYAQINKVGSTNKYTVQRDGKSVELQVTLAKVPDEVFAGMLGQHMLEHSSLQSAAK
jgi:hypothetical protein